MDKKLPKTKRMKNNGETNAPKIPVLDYSDIIGCTFLMPPQNYCQTIIGLHC